MNTIPSPELSIPEPDFSEVAKAAELAREANLEKEENDVLEALLEEDQDIFGIKVRPLTLASLALLKKTNSVLVSGKSIEEIQDDVFIDCCKLLYIQSAPLPEVVKVCKDPDDLECKAYELAERIPPHRAEGFVNLVMDMLSASQRNKVVPIPDKNHPASTEDETMGE